MKLHFEVPRCRNGCTLQINGLGRRLTQAALMLVTLLAVGIVWNSAAWAAKTTGYVETPDGVPLYYEKQGSGKTVVLIHGWTMNGAYWWQKNVPALANTHQVVAIDLRGHGLSGKTSQGHSIEQYAKDVRHLLEELRLTDVTLVGWSMGTAVILGYVEQFGTDRLRSVAFVDQSPFFFTVPGWDHPLLGDFSPQALAGLVEGLRSDRAATAKGFIGAMFAEPPPPAVVDRMYAETTKMPTEAAIAAIQDLSFRDLRPVLAEVTVPALLMYGQTNNIFPTDVGGWLQANMPDAKLVRFQQSGHCPFWEEPDKFNTELAKFVR